MLTLFQSYYLIGALVAGVIIIIEHITCRTSIEPKDFIIVSCWPYFLIFAVVLLIKGVYNLVKYHLRTKS